MPLAPPPLPPVFPGPRPRDGLKPATRARLAQAQPRPRAVPLLAQPMSLTRYDAQTHGLDFLVYWWAQARDAGEHLDLLGSVAATPMAFLKAYAGCDLTVMHDQDAHWQQGDGVVAVIWSSDVLPGARYRLDYWIAPAFRHPRLSGQIAHGILRHLFEVRGFQLVWGLTPMTNRLALRVLLRWGFTTRQVWPGGTIDPHTGAPMDAMCTLLTRDEWRAIDAMQREG